LNAPLNITGVYNYYPYGMQIENRCYEAPTANRFGFQGQQRDDEINGKGNTLNYEYRNYDAQIGIFKSIDPLAEKYAGMSPYAAFGLNPIMYVDPDGRDYNRQVDHNKGKVIISVDLYTLAGSGTSVSNDAKMKWEGENGKWNYIVEMSDKSLIYPIEFKVNVIECIDNAELNSKFRADFSATGTQNGNVFLSQPDQNSTFWGSSGANGYKPYSMNFSKVDDTQEAKNRETAGHELGHLLGLSHYNMGLMQDGVNRTDNTIHPPYIEYILNKAGLGSPSQEPIYDETPNNIVTPKILPSIGTEPANFNSGYVEPTNN